MKQNDSEPERSISSSENKTFFEYINTLKTSSRNWFTRRAHGRNAQRWLALLSFSEASFFPFPPDLLLIPILLASASRWVYYAFLTTLFSVLGGVAGYFIGAFFFEMIGTPVILFYGLEMEMIRVGEFFETNAFFAIFAAAFTPIPYKVFTLGAGFFSINFLVFIFASILGRGMRFFAISYAVSLFGDKIGNFVFKYFNILSLIVILWLFVFLFLMKIF